MNKKAVFFDIDGTLYEYKYGIPDSAKEGVAKLKENGHIPVICTGRAKAYIEQEILDMGFDHIIAAAGTYVEADGEVLVNKRIDSGELKKSLEILDKHRVKYIFEGPSCMYYNVHEQDEEYRRRVKEWDGIVPMEPFNYQNSTVNKFSCFLEESNLTPATTELGELFDMVIHDNMPFSEALPKGVSKAYGIRKLIEKLGINREDTYAFGDSRNDLEMLSYVRYGIAMGNASESILNHTKYHTKALMDDGIYYGLQKFGLI